MSHIICKFVRCNLILEPNILFKNNVAVTSLAQTFRSITNESSENQQTKITRKENKGPLRFYSDKLLTDKIEKLLKAHKYDKSSKIKKFNAPKKKLDIQKPLKNFETQMLNNKPNWLSNLTNSKSKEIDCIENTKSTAATPDVQPQNIVSASRRKIPIRSINISNFLQAKIEHAFARGYTNYVTPARYHHMNATTVLKTQKLGPLICMIHETLMPINKEVREKIAVPQLANISKPNKRIFGWDHPPPVAKFEFSFTPTIDKQQLSEKRTRHDASRRFKQQSCIDEVEVLPEPMRRWNEYYNRCSKEKTMLRCNFDVEKPRKSIQTEKLDALLKLSHRRAAAANDIDKLQLKKTPRMDMDRNSRYTHIVNINQAKCNPH